MNDDATLLRLYAETHDQAAFAQLAGRHLGLVYQAALRRLNGDAHAAADVSQQVFVKLAAQAQRLANHGALEAWLYATTRNAALDRLRAEQLRRQREQESATMQDERNAGPAETNWEALRPELDAALDKLGETDRKALLLRFFSNHSYAELGRALGLGEDAARRRTDRALEKLRLRLQRHGIHSSAAALATTLGAQAAAPVPATLLSQICAAAPLPLAAGTGVAAAGTLLMNTAKTITTTLLAGACLATGVCLYFQYTRAGKAETRIVALEKRNADLERELARLHKGEPAKTSELDDYLKLHTKTLDDELAKVAALKEVLARLPHLAIPEFRLCTEADWLKVVEGKMETSEDYRRALAALRRIAQDRFSSLLQQGLRKYLEANQNQFPQQVESLLTFADTRLGSDMTARYQIIPNSELPNVRMSDRNGSIITLKSLIDEEYDSTPVVGNNGVGSTSMGLVMQKEAAVIRSLTKAYQEAGGSGNPESLLQLLPYATTDAQRAVVEKWAKRYKKQ